MSRGYGPLSSSGVQAIVIIRVRAGRGRVGSGQVGSGQVRSGRVPPGQVGSGRVGSGQPQINGSTLNSTSY